MLRAYYLLRQKHNADEKQIMILEAFKEKIKNDPEGKQILDYFDIRTTNIFSLMEVYVKDILSSNEFFYMIEEFNNISDSCIQAFIDGMTLDDADWARTISHGSSDTLEKVFSLIVRGYSKKQIETFAKQYYELKVHFDTHHYEFKEYEGKLKWDATILYDIVLGYPNISEGTIRICADLLRNNPVNMSNTKLFIKLLEMNCDIGEIYLLYLNENILEYTDQEIIDVLMDFKLLYNN